MITVNANEPQVMIAVILELIAALSAFGTAVFMYPILKKYIESLAIAYVGLRLLENTFYILGVVSLIVLLTLSKEYTGAINATYQPLSNLVIALSDWAIAIGTLILFGIGSITLNYVLYQSKLVPRWLSAWGFIGAVLVILYGLIGMITLDPNMITTNLTILALPIAVQEMVFAVWLIIKGFNPSVIASLSVETDINELK